MTPEQKIKAIAEIDDVKFYNNELCRRQIPASECDCSTRSLKPYLTSYDAIIPVIQKQVLFEEVEDLIWTMFRCEWAFEATPAQLAKALLKACGKWVE